MELHSLYGVSTVVPTAPDACVVCAKGGLYRVAPGLAAPAWCGKVYCALDWLEFVPPDPDRGDQAPALQGFGSNRSFVYRADAGGYHHAGGRARRQARGRGFLARELGGGWTLESPVTFRRDRGAGHRPLPRYATRRAGALPHAAFDDRRVLTAIGPASTLVLLSPGAGCPDDPLVGYRFDHATWAAGPAWACDLSRRASENYWWFRASGGVVLGRRCYSLSPGGPGLFVTVAHGGAVTSRPCLQADAARVAYAADFLGDRVALALAGTNKLVVFRGTDEWVVEPVPRYKVRVVRFTPDGAGLWFATSRHVGRLDLE